MRKRGCRMRLVLTKPLYRLTTWRNPMQSEAVICRLQPTWPVRHCSSGNRMMRIFMSCKNISYLKADWTTLNTATTEKHRISYGQSKDGCIYARVRQLTIRPLLSGLLTWWTSTISDSDDRMTRLSPVLAGRNESYGFDMEKIRQGPVTWTYPMKQLGGLFEEHRIISNNNPMLPVVRYQYCKEIYKQGRHRKHPTGEKQARRSALTVWWVC